MEFEEFKYSCIELLSDEKTKDTKQLERLIKQYKEAEKQRLFERTLEIASKAAGCTPEDAKSKKKPHENVLARALFCYHLREHLKFTLVESGSYLGKSHDAVKYYISLIRNDIKMNNRQTINAFTKFKQLI